MSAAVIAPVLDLLILSAISLALPRSLRLALAAALPAAVLFIAAKQLARPLLNAPSTPTSKPALEAPTPARTPPPSPSIARRASHGGSETERPHIVRRHTSPPGPRLSLSMPRREALYDYLGLAAVEPSPKPRLEARPIGVPWRGLVAQRAIAAH